MGLIGFLSFWFLLNLFKLGKFRRGRFRFMLGVVVVRLVVMARLVVVLGLEPVIIGELEAIVRGGLISCLLFIVTANRFLTMFQLTLGHLS